MRKTLNWERLRVMFQGDDFGGSALQVGTFHRLADAIRRGCLVRPKKSKRCFRRGTDAADALGAAMATTEKANNKRYTKREIVEMFPELARSCAHPASSRQALLINILVYQNDYLDWTREKIADWLCRAGDCPHEIHHPELTVAPDRPRPCPPPRPVMPTVERKPAERPERPVIMQPQKSLDDCVIPAPSNFHNIAEAMQRVCVLRPQKIKGTWKRGSKGACTVGAIAEGAGFRENGMPWEKIWKMFPELQGLMAHPLRNSRMEVWEVISAVSEETNYSREQIADWLCIESGCTHVVQTSGLNLPRAVVALAAS
jgi:hypothetical protein